MAWSSSSRSSCNCLLVLAGIPAGLTACDRSSSPPPQPTPVTAASVAPPPKSQIADAEITRAIERHLQDERVFRTKPVHVAVTQDIANLTGQVESLVAKERAVAVAETIKGVRSVVDQVTVAPVMRTDQQLKSDVTKELRRDPATRAYTIGVDVKDGQVKLEGTADSWQQRNLFADATKVVPGIKAIDNAITVHYTSEYPAREIAEAVKRRIANDVWLDGNVLTTTVAGHAVKLSGTVASVDQKTRARSDAWARGVDAVDDSDVVVDWFAHNDQRRVIEAPLVSDPQIGDAVRDALRLDPRFKTLMPQVAVNGGIVTLTGTVDSVKALRAAERDANDTMGVWRVNNEVLVQPSGKPTDGDLERTVKRALSEDLLLSDAKSVQVSSSKGKILLKGTVASDFERFDAVEDALSVPGVAAVDVGLVVKHTPAEIKEATEDRLYWDPRVERDRVSVSVGPDGVVTLTGTLDAWSEIKAATDDALRGGAARVINVLTLKKHPEVKAP